MRPSSTGAVSMSRAAKKRAKKKKRNQSNQNQTGESGTKDTASSPAAAGSSASASPPPTRKKVKTCDAESQNDKYPLPSDVGTKAVKKDPTSLEVQGVEDERIFSGLSLKQILLLEGTSVSGKKNESDELLRNITSRQRAREIFQALIDPIPASQFYKEFWEKKPVMIPAKGNDKRYDGMLSLESIRDMSKNHSLYYARDLNVTRYEKDPHGVKRRITLDKLPENETDEATGVLVDSSELWAHYKSGCTIRLLCPHKHEDSVHALLSTLELEFGCMIGANAYLTPPNAAQGFAPHYDDIEAFCLQLQGRKRWKVYEPNLKLPRESSADFTPDDVKTLNQVMDVTLGPGDLLYMPRGWIHQACTLPHSDEHSLHLTVSAMQNWAWVDLVDIIMPNAVEAAAMSDTSTSLRQGLPRGFLDYMGTMHDTSVDENLPESMKKIGGGSSGSGEVDSDDDDELAQTTKIQLEQQRIAKERFKEEAKKRIMRVAKAAFDMVDAACDELGKRFQSDRLPPAFTSLERAATNLDDENKAEEQKAILPSTLCRIARPGIARLVLEDNQAVVYHCADNARVYHAAPISPLEFEMDDGPALEQLLTTEEPAWIMVHELIHDTIQDKVAIAQALYDDSILAIQNPAGGAGADVDTGVHMQHGEEGAPNGDDSGSEVNDDGDSGEGF